MILWIKILLSEKIDEITRKAVRQRAGLERRSVSRMSQS